MTSLSLRTLLLLRLSISFRLFLLSFSLLLAILLLILGRLLPVKLNSILLAVDDPADAHLAEVEVVIFSVRVLPALDP